jgi:hypothetical protein
MMSTFRRSLLASGLGGLLACGLLAALGTWLVTSGTIEVLLPHRLLVLLMGLILGAFSLAEIPMMVFALRRLAVERQGNRGLVIGLNVFYVFFAAVYGLPVLLLTGNLAWGLTLCGFGLLRFITSLIFVREPAP